MKFEKPNGVITLICMSLAFLMSGHAGVLHGQNISTQPTSSLEAGYQRALELHHTAKGAALADSLYTVSVKSGDKKMQCDLLKLLIEYYVTTNDDEKVKETCEHLRSVAVKTDNENDVFWSYRQQVKYLVDHTRLLEAIDLTDEMKKDAEKMESVFGTYLMHLTVGDIYKARNDKEIARDSYIKAMNLQKRFLKDVDATMPHIYLSEIYRRKSGRTASDLDSCKLFISEGLMLTSDPMNRARLFSEEAMLFHSQQDYDSFNEAYSRVLAELGTDTLPDEFIQIYYRKKILDGDYDGALRLIERIPSDYDRHIAKYLLYKREDDYKNALISYENANHALNIIRENRSRTTLEELDRKIGNLELTIENQKLQHENNVITSIVLSVIFLIVLLALYFVLKLWNQAKKAGEELKVKNQELELARDEAVRSEEMKTIFIQNMSHEIRTPLNAIVGFSDILATQSDELEESERKEFAELIQHNNDLLTKLVTDILTLSDLDSGKNEIDYSKVKVNKLCRNILQSVRHRVLNNVLLEFETEVSDKLEIDTDEIRLTQVLNNILVNACKYTTNGSITLECRIKGEKIEFAVKDTGPGIPPERREEIFERFTKLDNFHQGTGLGLNICRTLVEMMHGKIYVDDRYVGGSRFVVVLPIKS